MKHIFILTVCTCFTIAANSQQNITPLQTNEYCPNVEYTFTATIPKPYSSMIGQGSCVITQLPTPPVGSTFTFKGKFGDANQKQSFKINYTDGTSFDFDYKKIKSLFYGTTCTPIQPSVSQISAPRCQIVNTAISFSNVQWSTNFESPILCFGSIAEYEYQLPANWKIGTFTSTGSNWYAGGNNVTITSDISSGDGGVITIRPKNTACGNVLTNGVSQAVSIPISRPEPSFTFTNSAYQICSGLNGVYTINGMPAGSTVVWSVTSTNGTPTTLAQIAGSNTNPTVTVAANATAAGLIKITATVTHCTYIYTPSQTLQIGVGTYPTVRLNYDANCGKLFQAIPYFIAGDGIGTTGFSWNLSGDVNLNTTTTDDLVINPLINNPVNNKTYKVFVKVRAITGCGTSIQNPFIYVVNIGPVNLNACSGGGVLRQLVNSNSVDDNITTAPSFETSNSKISISPNPSNGQFIVVLNAKNKNAGIKQIIVKNKIGIPVYRQTFSNNQQQQNIDISGNPTDIYIVEIFDGKQWITQKLSLQR